jgi:hypothetical protein
MNDTPPNQFIGERPCFLRPGFSRFKVPDGPLPLRFPCRTFSSFKTHLFAVSLLPWQIRYERLFVWRGLMDAELRHILWRNAHTRIFDKEPSFASPLFDKPTLNLLK